MRTLSRRSFLAVAGGSISSFSVIGCGGGGTGNGGGGQVIGQTTVTVNPNQAAEKALGKALVKFPAGSFSSTQEVTITETNPYFQTTKSGFRATQPQLALGGMTEAPLQPITVEYPDAPGLLVAAALDGQLPIGAYPVDQINGKAVVLIDPSLVGRDRNRGSSPAIYLLLGLASVVDSPDRNPGLTLIEGGAMSNSLIVVHGLLQDATDVREMALRAKALGSYGAVYSFRYDYRWGIEQAGQALADTLKTYGFDPKTVDIIAYSKGGLVTRWALEKEGATKPVDQVIFMATPNTGCKASLAGLYFTLGGAYFGLKHGLPFIDWRDDYLGELMLNSTALSSLNQYRHQQNGLVRYYFFAGDGDDVVAENSAYAYGVDLGDLTNGRLYTELLTGFGHMTMDEPEAIAAAWPKIRSVTSGLDVSWYENPTDPDPWVGDWSSVQTISNNTSGPMPVATIEYEMSDLNGDWTGNYWFDPNYPPGVLFPHQRVDLGNQLVIPPGEFVQLGIGFWADEDKTPVWNAAPSRQAMTCHTIVHATAPSGQEVRSEVVLRLKNGSLEPADPKTRLRNEPDRRAGMILKHIRKSWIR